MRRRQREFGFFLPFRQRAKENEWIDEWNRDGTMAEIGMTSFLGYPLPTREDKVLQVVPWGHVFLTEAHMNVELNKMD